MSGKQKCPRCLLSLPLEEFTRDRRRPSGRASYCRPCDAEYHRIRTKHGLSVRSRRGAVIARRDDARTPDEWLRNAAERLAGRAG